MSLRKVIYEVDYLAYGGLLAGVWAAIPRRMAGNRLASDGGERGQCSLTGLTGLVDSW